MEKKIKASSALAFAAIAGGVSTPTIYAEVVNASPIETPIVAEATQKTITKEDVSDAKSAVDVATENVIKAQKVVETVSETEKAATATVVELEEKISKVENADSFIAKQEQVISDMTVEKTAAEVELASAQSEKSSAEADLATSTAKIDAVTAEIVATESVVATAKVATETASQELASAKAALAEAEAKPVATTETIDREIATKEASVASKTAELSATSQAIVATSAAVDAKATEVANYTPTTQTTNVAETNYVDATLADKDLETLYGEDYKRPFETVLFNGEDVKTIELTDAQKAELKEKGYFTYTYDAKAVTAEVIKLIEELRRINNITLSPWVSGDDISMKIDDEFLAFAQERANEVKELTEKNGYLSHESHLTAPRSYSESLGQFTTSMTSNVQDGSILSNEEMAYTNLLDWFSEYANTQVNYGHRIHLLTLTGNVAFGMVKAEDGQLYSALLSDGNGVEPLSFKQSTVDGKLTQTLNGERLKFLPKRTFRYVSTDVIDNSATLQSELNELKARQTELVATKDTLVATIATLNSDIQALEASKSDVAAVNNARLATIETAKEAVSDATVAYESAVSDLNAVETKLADLNGQLVEAKAQETTKVATLQKAMKRVSDLIQQIDTLVSRIDAATNLRDEAEKSKNNLGKLKAQLADAKVTQSLAIANKDKADKVLEVAQITLRKANDEYLRLLNLYNLQQTFENTQDDTKQLVTFTDSSAPLTIEPKLEMKTTVYESNHTQLSRSEKYSELPKTGMSGIVLLEIVGASILTSMGVIGYRKQRKSRYMVK